MTLPPTFAESDPDRAAWLAKSALEQAQAIRDGTTTSTALVDLYLHRIARHDPQLGAFVDVYAESARADAAAKDRQRQNRRELPAFHGVPLALKDLHMVRGRFTRLGSRAFRYLWSPVDDVTTRLLRRAGFVLLGKTSTSELALLPMVETDIHPPTRNPWNLERISGGSSGGAAAAVAAGLLPLAPGSDGGGSIRIPSALCGLVGLKTSRGRVPNPHAHVDPDGMAVIGPIARSIDDAAALADALSGRDPRLANSWLAAARAPVAPGLRVALMRENPLGVAVEASRAQATLAVAERLTALGHTVTEVPRVGATLAEFMPVYQRIFARTPVPFPGKLQPVTRWFREQGRRNSDADVRRAFESLNARAEAALQRFDLVLSPTVAIATPKVGALTHLPPPELFEAAAPLGAFTAAWNLTGRPALTLPWGKDGDGMPLGVQLAGRHGDDERLLALGRHLLAN